MLAFGIAVSALVVSIIASVVSAGSVIYTRSQAKSYKKIEANDSARRADELADRKAAEEHTGVADVRWTASDRTAAPSNNNGFTELVKLTTTNNGPHIADDVALEVPTTGFSYELTHYGSGPLHPGESRTTGMLMDRASIGGMNPTIRVHWVDGRDGRQTFERELTPWLGLS